MNVNEFETRLDDLKRQYGFVALRLEKEVDEKTKELEKLLTELQSHKDEILTLRSMNETLTLEKDHLSSTLQEKESFIDSLQEDQATTLKEYASLKTSIDQQPREQLKTIKTLTEKVGKLERENSELRVDNEQKDLIIDSMTKHRDEIWAELDKEKEENEHLNGTVNKQNDLLKNLADSIQQKSEQIRLKVQQFVVCQNRLNDKTFQLEQLQKRYDKLNSDVDTYIKRAQEMEDQNRELVLDVHDKNNEIVSLKVRLYDVYVSKEEKIVDLNNQVQEMSTQVNIDQMQTIKVLRRRVRRLTDRWKFYW